jgi:CelD/BcsL family acetyltransferase involved in cellulose biosynthesis
MMPRVYTINPLHDVRWPQLLATHPLAGIFHSKEWLDALVRTYGFTSRVLTMSGPDEALTNGLVFCQIRSRLTGRRLVSVPFSDHCAPLVDSEEQLDSLISHLRQEANNGGEKYFEIRSIAAGIGVPPGLTQSATYCIHRIDLRKETDELFRSFHNSCIRRKIKRAELEMTYQEGTSEALLRTFYQLMVPARRLHGIPPQPLSWFRNLIACMGERIKIRLACCEGRPASAIITIRDNYTMTYKYGCSDPHFHKFGCMQLLMWRAIQEAKSDGLLVFDMGRTEWGDEGLLTFKDRWGAARSNLHYLRNRVGGKPSGGRDIATRIATRVLVGAPDRLFIAAGNLLYRHFA